MSRNWFLTHKTLIFPMNFRRPLVLLFTMALALFLPGCVTLDPQESHADQRPAPERRYRDDSNQRFDPRYRDDHRRREDYRHRGDYRDREDRRPRDEYRRPEITRPREEHVPVIPGYKLVPGNGFAGPGYYYGPPHAPYHYEGRGVRFYPARESAPRIYRMQ